MLKSKLTASDLDAVIAIEQYTSVSDGMGGNARTWATLIERLHCKAERLGAAEQARTGIIQASTVFRFTIRRRTGITTNMRVVYGGVRYNIRSFAPDTTRDRMMAIIAESGVANG